MSSLREGNVSDHYVMDMLGTLDKILNINRDLEKAGHETVPYVHDIVAAYVDMDNMERLWSRLDYDNVKKLHAEGWSLYVIESTGVVPEFSVREYLDGTADTEISSHL